MYQSIEQKVSCMKDLHGKLAAIISAQLQFVEEMPLLQNISSRRKRTVAFDDGFLSSGIEGRLFQTFIFY